MKELFSGHVFGVEFKVKMIGPGCIYGSFYVVEGCFTFFYIKEENIKSRGDHSDNGFRLFFFKRGRGKWTMKVGVPLRGV